MQIRIRIKSLATLVRTTLWAGLLAGCFVLTSIAQPMDTPWTVQTGIQQARSPAPVTEGVQRCLSLGCQKVAWLSTPAREQTQPAAFSVPQAVTLPSAKTVTAHNLLVGSVAGWAVGTIGGALIGNTLQADSDQALVLHASPLVTGGMVGASVGTTVGAYASSGFRAHPLLTSAVSLGVGVGGLLLWRRVHAGEGNAYVADALFFGGVPLLQIGLTVQMSRITAR